jgi:ADP-dependent NAD(P)H-hydrate dehydratase / NAD(P)H-hydrate epimerase
VIVVGGAHGMTGAPMLAARAAAFSGAGRVYAAFVGDVPAYDDAHPELMCRPAQSMEFSMATVVAGPGLGTSPAALELLRKMLTTPSLLVLDADALNLIAAHPDLQQQLVRRAGDTLLTPHPLEAARLLGMTSKAVQSDRVAAARELANRFQAVAVLKGSGTVIAAPGGAAMINTSGNPGLATAGSGDVLAGVCGALLAQGWPVWQAALGAVWMHGRAADLLVEQGIGPIGLTAGELIPTARQILNSLVAERR